MLSSYQLPQSCFNIVSRDLPLTTFMYMATTEIKVQLKHGHVNQHLTPILTRLDSNPVHVTEELQDLKRTCPRWEP